MAEIVNADLFVIVTAVDGIYLDYNTKNQKILRNLKNIIFKKFINQKVFPSVSIWPKVEKKFQLASSKLSIKSIITL